MDAYVLLMKLIALVIAWFVWDWLIDWVFTRLGEWLGCGSDDGTDGDTGDAI